MAKPPSHNEEVVLRTAMALLDNQILLWQDFSREFVQHCTGPNAPNLERGQVFQILGFLARVYNAKDMAEGLTILARSRKETPAHAVARATIEGLINSVHCLVVPDEEHLRETSFIIERVQKALLQGNSLRGLGRTKEEQLKVPDKLARIRASSLPVDVHPALLKAYENVYEEASKRVHGDLHGSMMTAVSYAPLPNQGEHLENLVLWVNISMNATLQAAAARYGPFFPLAHDMAKASAAQVRKLGQVVEAKENTKGAQNAGKPSGLP